jgi:hypothetical protein
MTGRSAGLEPVGTTLFNPWVSEGKREATSQDRVAKTVERLKAGVSRRRCFGWRRVPGA